MLCYLDIMYGCYILTVFLITHHKRVMYEDTLTFDEG